MKKIVVLVCLLVASTHLYSSYPTPEGLFRFGPERNIENDLLLVDLRIKRIPNKDLLAATLDFDIDSDILEREMSVQVDELFVQLIMTKNERNNIELAQIIFDDGSFDENKARDIVFIQNLSSRVREDHSTLRSLYNGLVGMYVLNSSEAIATLLSLSVPGFKRNNDLINQEKYRLLTRYKEYLKLRSSSEDEQGEEEILSPMTSEDSDVQDRINKIMASPMYPKDEALQLVKRGRQFLWQLSYENFSALFTNEGHDLTTLSLQMTESPIRVRINDYVLISGDRRLPQTMFLETHRRELYEVGFVNFRRVRNRADQMHSIVRNYRESIQAKDEREKGYKFEFLY